MVAGLCLGTNGLRAKQRARLRWPQWVRAGERAPILTNGTGFRGRMLGAGHVSLLDPRVLLLMVTGNSSICSPQGFFLQRQLGGTLL